MTIINDIYKGQSYSKSGDAINNKKTGANFFMKHQHEGILDAINNDISKGHPFSRSRASSMGTHVRNLELQ